VSRITTVSRINAVSRLKTRPRTFPGRTLTLASSALAVAAVSVGAAAASPIGASPVGAGPIGAGPGPVLPMALGPVAGSSGPTITAAGRPVTGGPATGGPVTGGPVTGGPAAISAVTGGFGAGGHIVLDAFTQPLQAAGTGAVRPARRLTARQIAWFMLKAYGWTTREYPSLSSLWARESGWNPYARNSYSGAYGIPQAMPGGKMASAGGDWRTNPRTQIRWGLHYIKAVYGSPSRAWRHELSYGWY
jgi:Transglycosylase SLT domain